MISMVLVMNNTAGPTYRLATNEEWLCLCYPSPHKLYDDKYGDSNWCPPKYCGHILLVGCHPFSPLWLLTRNEWERATLPSWKEVLIANTVRSVWFWEGNLSSIHSGVLIECLYSEGSLVTCRQRLIFVAKVIKWKSRPVERGHDYHRHTSQAEEIAARKLWNVCAKLRRTFPCAHQAELVHKVFDEQSKGAQKERTWKDGTIPNTQE